jgi:outer membrane protein TolC
MHDASRIRQLRKPGKLGTAWQVRFRAGTAVILAILLAVATAGCTRRYFRKSADRQVDAILTEKDRYPAWQIEQYHVYPDPRARFADPTNPDRPPMPPDDPAAHHLSPNPQKPGRAGVALVGGTGYLDLLAAWNEENRQKAAEADEKPVETTDTGAAPDKPDAAAPCRPQPFLINLEQSSELGLINSREFQDQREDLYLAALAVVVERFAFSAQFFATGAAIGEWAGRDSSDGPQNRATLNSRAGFSQLFPTGALLLFRLANQTVINFSGLNPRPTISQSTLTLDLFQPLLRGGGFAVTLEPLTQSERSLLYQIRDYAHFRKGFYVFLAGGAPFDVGTRGGAEFSVRGTGGRALALSLSGGDIGAPAVSPGLGGTALADLGLAPTEGYLPTLLLKAELENERANVTALESSLTLFEAVKERGDVSQLQVDQVELQLLQGRSTVLQRDQDLRDALDRFKLQLGAPPNLLLELDDEPLRPLYGQLKSYQQVLDEFEAARQEAEGKGLEDPAPRRAAATLGILLGVPTDPETPAALAIAFAVNQLGPGAGLVAEPLRERLRTLATTAPLVKGTHFAEHIQSRWPAWEALPPGALPVLRRLEQIGEERRQLLALKTERETDPSHPGQSLTPEEAARLAELEFDLDLGNFERSLRLFEEQPWNNQPTPERQLRVYLARRRDALNAFVLLLGAARNERLDRLREAWPTLPPVKLEDHDLITGDLDEALTRAGQAALTNRFDLMNERARLVDAWRQIAVLANALLGTFNVEYHLDTVTPPLVSRPLSFGGSGNRNQLIVNGELPLVRKIEQNNYRAGLIGYQRQRRQLMEQEDLVLNTVRQEIRQLRQLAENYKIQQRAVQLAYLQVENALETFQAPPQPSVTNTAGDAAALTQQLLGAQSALRSAKNQLFVIWINFQTARLQLYRDLELMPLDERGVWIDELVHPTPGDTAPNGHPACDGPASQREGGPLEQLPEPTPLPPAARPPS